MHRERLNTRHIAVSLSGSLPGHAFFGCTVTAKKPCSARLHAARQPYGQLSAGGLPGPSRVLSEQLERLNRNPFNTSRTPSVIVCSPAHRKHITEQNRNEADNFSVGIPDTEKTFCSDRAAQRQQSSCGCRLRYLFPHTPHPKLSREELIFKN